MVEMILVDRVEMDTMEEQVDLDTLMELELYNFRLVDVVMVEPVVMRMLLVLEVLAVMQKVEMVVEQEPADGLEEVEVAVVPLQFMIL